MKEKILNLRSDGKTYNQIKVILKCSKSTISYYCGIEQKHKTLVRQQKNRDRKRAGERWDNELLNKVVSLLKEGKNCTEISSLIKHRKSPTSIIKKLHRLGYKGADYGIFNRGGKKVYENMDWNKIQTKYNNGCNTKELGISAHAIAWGKENGLLITRNRKEAIAMAIKLGRWPKSSSVGLIRYRQLCEFKFGVKDYPQHFDLSLIEKHGWYKAKNRGNNLNGISRDHIYSVYDGYKNNIDPIIISHPANCRLVRHRDNQKKKSKSKITLKELKHRIKKWSDA